MTEPAAPSSTGEATVVASRDAGVLATLERLLGLTRLGLGMLAAVILMVALGRVLPSRSLTLLGYGLGFALALSWGIGRRNLPIQAERSTLPRRIPAGRTVDATLTLNTSRRVSAIVVEETLDPALGSTVRIAVPVVSSSRSVDHDYTFTPTHRGIFRVGPMVAEYSDPFGLTRRRQEIAPAIDILVHPRTEHVLDRITVRQWEDPLIRPPFSRPWPVGSEFYGMRDYIDGDDPRRIVWRAVAQYGKVMVRESEQGITDRVNLWLDTDASKHSPGTPSDTLEASVNVAASLAVQHLKDGFSVCLDTNNERLMKSARGNAKRIPFLDVLAGVKADATPFTASLDRLFVDPQRSAHNVLITPSISQVASTTMRVLIDRGLSLVVVLVLSEDTDSMTIHRASGLGCSVVEVRSGIALGPSFRAAARLVRR